MSFHYDNKEDYATLLADAHNTLLARFERLDDSKNALELQNILTEIKRTARSLGKNRDPVDQALYDQYKELIDTATSLQNQSRANKSGLGQFSSSGLFSRAHDIKTSTNLADDIFEEDLAAVLAAAGQLYGENLQDVNIEMFLFGGKSASSRAIKNVDFEDELGNTVIDLINKMAEKAEYRAKSKSFRVATGKIDVRGYSKTLEISLDTPVKIARLMELMKDATFSAKNYRSYRKGNYIDIDEIGLHLGNTNLYKAVTGVLSEIGAGRKQQNSFFYRGAYTYLGNKHGLEEEVAAHFGHMRLIYELRGSGLLDETGHVLPVKYLIYNDPSSDVVYVKDTASLLKDLLTSTKVNYKLFGGITLSAGKVKS